MGQKLLLALGAALVVAAIGVGAVGAATGRFGPVGVSPGVGMMGAGGMWRGPGGMMGGYSAQTATGQAITIDQAQQAVEQYVARYGSSDLAVDEVIEFQNNFYAAIKEKSTGIGAFELLVNRSTGTVTPEPGPNMMWNTAYGMMGARLQTGTMTVTSDRAGQLAQAWLDANQNGAKVGSVDEFHGYYTVDFTRDGKLAGMLSVNGYTGQVWYHTWHGTFIQQREVGG